jgi:hypothetical protein
MTKREVIERAEKILKDFGCTNGRDYVMSLQGPTIIFAITGKEKFENDPILRAEIINTGIEILC